MRGPVVVDALWAAVQKSVCPHSNDEIFLRLSGMRHLGGRSKKSGDSMLTALMKALKLPFRPSFKERYRVAKLDLDQIRVAEIVRTEFDPAFYFAENPDVAAQGVDPLIHYVRHGGLEGRRPNADFDPGFYRSKNREVPSKVDAFFHYLTVGREKGYLTKPNTAFFVSNSLTLASGVTPSRRPTNYSDFAFGTPFPEAMFSTGYDRVAAAIHAFYPELVPEILAYLGNVPCAVDLFITTNTTEKADAIAAFCADYAGGATHISVVDNFGRDIAPFIALLPRLSQSYEVVLHVHTKKSPHGGDPLESWRPYLLDNLLGSPEIVSSIFTLLRETKAGIVFPQHLFDLRGILNWGFDFDLSSALMRRLGVKIDKDMVLEFPSGSMFWAKTAALRDLQRLALGKSDFAAEAGQVDGTLAHAIERSLLMFAEHARFQWAKVLRTDTSYPHPECVLSVRTVDELKQRMPIVYRPLLQPPVSGRLATERAMPETRLLGYHPSNIERPRLNLFVPTVNPHQVFGGVGTALRLLREMIAEWGGEMDFRIIATDARVETGAMHGFPGYQFKTIDPVDSGEPLLVVDAALRDAERLDLRRNDTFIATAWWTAGFSSEARKAQRRFFDETNEFIYLIQDYEPNFYGWGSRWLMAENTYRRGENAIAIVNSEELFKFFRQSTYSFKKMYCLPYALDERLEKMITPKAREKIILVYGRPSVGRNAFEILIDGLTTWQIRNPTIAANWRIISVGAEYPAEFADPVQNVTVLGKLGFDEYAHWLGKSSIGIALMVSPHPSYPPLEMAAAGLMTITNSFDVKNTARRFANIHSIEPLDADAIADALEICAARYDTGAFPITSGLGVPLPLDQTDMEIYRTALMKPYMKGLAG